MSAWTHVHAPKGTVVLNVNKAYALIISSSTRLTHVAEEETVHTLTYVNVNMVIQDSCVNMWNVTEEWTFIHSSVQHMAYVFNQIHVSVTTVGQVRTVSIQFATVSRPMKQMFVTIMADVLHRIHVSVIMDTMGQNARIQVALVSLILTLGYVPLMVCAMDLTSATVHMAGFRETVAFPHVSVSGEQTIPCVQNMGFVSNMTFVFVAQVEQATIVS